MAKITELQVSIGDVVTFTTLNSYHNIAITGKVVGVVSFAVARSISDIVRYQVEVKKTNTSGIDDLEDSKFVVIQTADEQKAYSFSWIDEADWEVVDAKGNVDIRLLNVDEGDVETALYVLTMNNISAKVIV